eukprot:gene270-144_t
MADPPHGAHDYLFHTSENQSFNTSQHVDVTYHSNGQDSVQRECLGTPCVEPTAYSHDPAADSHSFRGRRGGGLEEDRPTEAIFHPELRRTSEIIKKPVWLTAAAAGEVPAHRGKLNALALFGLLFAYCIGGGYGFEDGISAAGPLITLIVCVTLPWYMFDRLCYLFFIYCILGDYDKLVVCHRIYIDSAHAAALTCMEEGGVMA